MPNVSVINNVDVKAQTSAEAIKDALIRQLFNPVRWTETIKVFTENGINTVIEVGPGKVLQGLMKRIDKSITCVAFNDKTSLEKALELVKK